MMAFFRIAVAILAIAMIAVGIVWTISPLPFGFVLVILGVLLLAATAPTLVRWIRRRWRWLDRMFVRFERLLPRWLARLLRPADPRIVRR